MNILYYECSRCKGTGRINYGPKTRACKQCSGRGLIPTKLGEHIITFYDAFCRNGSQSENINVRKPRNSNP